MKLTGVHLLLTYQCTLQCDHCFVWGSPWQRGVMSAGRVHDLLGQSKALGTVEWFYFEGGEPFLYYPLLRWAVEEASTMGFRVGIISNGYWATTEDDAAHWLGPLVGLVHDLSISSDLYHWSEPASLQAANARAAAAALGIPVGTISVAQPSADESSAPRGQLPQGESPVMYRGRAAEKLAPRAAARPWEAFTSCEHENLRDPGRVHVDPLGNVHVCQGISIGNVFEKPLAEICETYDPETHPITGPILAGGPVALVTTYSLPHASTYADACHLCYEARSSLRSAFPDVLMPDQMYGV